MQDLIAQAAARKREAERQAKADAEEQAVSELAKRFQMPATQGTVDTSDVNAALPDYLRINPTPAIPAQAGGFDQKGFLSSLPSVLSPLKAMEYSKKFAPKEVEYSTAPQFTPDGRAYLVGKDGSVKWLDGGIKPRDKLVETNLGGKIGFRTEYSPEVQNLMDKTASPDAVLSSNTSIRGQNMTDARARESNKIAQGNFIADAGGPSQIELTKIFGKAETGRRWKPDGTLEAIPGGSADRKISEAGIKEDRQREGAIQQANRVISKVDEALGKVGYSTAGVGSVLSDVPGTPARDLRSTLDTIKANLGFAELQAMRDASPTGGALGAIAVQELMALQSTVASLDQAQSPQKLAKSLNDINKHYTNWKDAVAGRQPANPKPSPQNPSTVNPGNPRLNTTTPGRLKYDAQGNLMP